MFDIPLLIALVVLLVILGVMYTAVWRAYKREAARKETEHLLLAHLRAGRHRAEDRPTMKWRG